MCARIHEHILVVAAAEEVVRIAVADSEVAGRRVVGSWAADLIRRVALDRDIGRVEEEQVASIAAVVRGSLRAPATDIHRFEAAADSPVAAH